jgi:hypothetical protein
MATTSSCVSCKAPFPANRELATIPDASRIAFDPAHRRVWRICARCGEWNLLGAEASERALPELAARFAAAPKRAGGEGFAPTHVGSALELLQIGETMVAANDVAMQRRRRQLAWTKWATPAALLVGAAAIIAVQVWDYQRGQLSHTLLTLAICYAFVGLVHGVIKRRHNVPVNRPLVMLAAAVVIVGIPVDYMVERIYALAFIPVMAIAAIPAFTLRPFSYLTVRLANGTISRTYSRRDLKQMSISWNSGGALALHGLPDGAEVHGAEALVAIRKLAHVRNIVFVGRELSDAAYDLVRTAGGLQGVLRALEGFRQDNTGRVVLADLPKVYLLALDLALAKRELGDPPDNDGAIAEKSAEAAAIAAEAEALDRTMKEPAA